MVEVYETSTILCRDALFDDEIEGKNIHQSGQKSSDINQNLELKHQFSVLNWLRNVWLLSWAN